MKRLKKIILIAVITVICHLLTVNLVIAAGAGTTGASFLKIGVGARAVGMGEAFVAVADDASAIYWNPGGLDTLVKKEFTGMHLEWFEGIKYEGLTYVNPTENSGTWGIDVKYLSVGNLTKTVVNPASATGYDELGAFSAYDMMATIGYGKQVLDRLALGVALKYIKESLDNKDATALAGDFGLICEVEGGKFGLSLANLGTKLKFSKEEGDLPFTLKAGISSNLFKDKLILGLEVDKPNDANLSARVGTEIWLYKLFALRLGYKYTVDEKKDLDVTSGLTAGIGFGKRNQTESGLDYQLDYAFVPYGDLGYTHRASITVRFGESLAAPQTEAAKQEKKVKIAKVIPVAKPKPQPPKEELPQVVAKPAPPEIKKEELVSPSQLPEKPLQPHEQPVSSPVEAPQAEQNIIKVAMLDLFQSKSFPVSEANFVSKYFRGELAQSKSLEVLDRDKMNAILRKEGWNFGINKPGKKELLETGEILNVDKLIIGEVSLNEDRYILKIGVINVTTGKMEYTDSVTYSLFNIDQAIKDLASRIIKAMTAK